MIKGALAMASNKDLIADIIAMSALLEKEVPATEDLSNSDLANILSALKADKKEADKDLTPDAAAKAGAEAKAAAAKKRAKGVKKPPYYIAPRKALTTKRGILSGDDADAVTADDLYGGERTLSALVESGYIIKS